MVNDFLPDADGQQKHTPSQQPQHPSHNKHPHMPHGGHAYHWAQPSAQTIFKPPELIAAEEEKQAETTTANPLVSFHDPKKTGSSPSMPKAKKPKRSFKERLKSLSKKQWIIIGIVIVLLLSGGGFGAYWLLRSEPAPLVKKQTTTQKPAATKTPEPTTVASKLTGLQVDPAVNARPVTGIMIENSSSARPQSGLNDAGVVFEAIAEGGITRFLTLFQDTEPDYVGPVRSVRPYYVKWALGFDAPIAHVGGSADGLALVRANKDLDQFFNSSAYWRISSRAAPHNMYTSVPKLHEVEAKKGYTSSDYTGFARKDKEAPSATVTARSIDFTISSPLYNPHYDYDQATNTYKRSEGGKPHTDEKSGAQLAPKVVIALVMSQGKNGIYTTYETIGSGTVYIFQDGTVQQGTWSKSGNTSQFVFKDANGAQIALNPGQTWLSVVGSTSSVTYQP